MAHIWKSLVADSTRTIDKHFELIIDDLLIQSGSRLWRSRESSCLALADIIQGRKFDQVLKLMYFPSCCLNWLNHSLLMFMYSVDIRMSCNQKRVVACQRYCVGLDPRASLSLSPSLSPSLPLFVRRCVCVCVRANHICKKTDTVVMK